MVEFRRLEALVTTLRAGLVELQQSPSYLLLRDAAAGTVTATRYRAVVGDDPDLWPVIEAVDGRLVAIGSDIDEEGSPASIAADLAVVIDVPGLGPMTPAAALSQIRGRYDAIAAEVATIDRLWLNVLPRVEAARATLDRLDAEADELAIREPLIGRARTVAEDLAERLVSDPRGVEVAEGQRLDSQVAEAARLMAEARGGHDNLDIDLAGTEETLANLRILLARARAITTETTTKIADPGPLVALPSDEIIDGTRGLANRLDEVFLTDPGARWQHRRAALDRWLGQAQGLQRQLVRALDTNGHALDLRDELRGRLQAFQAKMAAVGLAEDAELSAIAERAWNHLYTAPTSLGDAEAAVGLLAERLRRSDDGPDRGQPGMQRDLRNHDLGKRKP